MNEKTTPQFQRLLTCILFLTLTGIGQTLYSQSNEALPGPISQLTLNENGEIACVIHANDNTAAVHHAVGAAKTGLKANGKTKTSTKTKKGSGTAQIFVDYYNFDPDFSFENFLTAATAFQSAVDIWAASISSEVPIFVAAVFQPLDDGVLGSAGPTSVYASAPGLERDTWYGNALADKLVGEDLDPTSYDVVARFSTVFPNWYFGTDANTPSGDFDFRTVVLHELGHGLGYFGSMLVDNDSGVGSYGFGIPSPVYPAIYDRLANSPDGKSILKDNRYGNFTTELGDVLLGGPLTAKGPRIKKATKGKGAKVFTVLDSQIFGDIPGLTDIWLRGSSYSHLDFVTYAGSSNGLMVPFLSRGLAYDKPGNIMLAVFDDMGWNGIVNKEIHDNNKNTQPGDDLAVIATDAQSRVTVYPNPFRSNVIITLGSEHQTVTKAMVSDAYGAIFEIPQENIQGTGSVEIDLSNIRNRTDFYFMQLTFEDGETEVIKLVRED